MSSLVPSQSCDKRSSLVWVGWRELDSQPSLFPHVTDSRDGWSSLLDIRDNTSISGCSVIAHDLIGTWGVMVKGLGWTTCVGELLSYRVSLGVL